MPVIDAFGARWTFDVSELDDDLAAELLRLWDRAVVTPDGSDGAATDPPPPFRGAPHRGRVARGAR